MINNIQKFRKILAEQRLGLGTGITLNDPTVTEAIAPLVDFVWIDLEHCPMGMETLLGHIIAARAGGVPSLVRVPDSDAAMIKRVLDTGAEGIIVPQVRSAIEVQRVVDACRYPPMGNRGWGPRRPSDYGRRSIQQILHEANEQLFVVVQIENVDSVAEIDAIAAIDGLDSLCIGPADLAASLGVLGELDHPKVISAVEKIVTTAHGAGKSVGFGDDEVAENSLRWVRLGADWVQCGCDFAYMLRTAKALFAQVRSGRESLAVNCGPK